MLKEMTDLLFAWQDWEIDFIFGNTKWKNRLPLLSRRIFNDYLKIQAERERLLEKLERNKIDDEWQSYV